MTDCTRLIYIVKIKDLSGFLLPIDFLKVFDSWNFYTTFLNFLVLVKYLLIALKFFIMKLKCMYYKVDTCPKKYTSVEDVDNMILCHHIYVFLVQRLWCSCL